MAKNKSQQDKKIQQNQAVLVLLSSILYCYFRAAVKPSGLNIPVV